MLPLAGWRPAMKAATAIGADASGVALTTRLRSLRDFRSLAVVTVLATYALIVLGGTVRATDSGTACPDWPLCHGRVIPPLETHVLIEYSHRLVASVVGFLILGTVFWAWRRERENKLVFRAGIATVALLAGQVALGGVTVKTETAASVVALHLAMALALLTIMIVIAVRSLAQSADRTRENRGGGLAEMAREIGGVRLVALAGTFALIIVGAYVSQTGAGLAYPDWPLFDGKLVSAGGRLADLHYAHRLLAAVVGLLLVALAVETWKRERRTVVMAVVALAVVVYAAQVIVGASNIWLDLATSVRIVHLALASALWGVLVFAVAWSYLATRTAAGEGVPGA